MNKPHVHAEVIKAWADGAVIEHRYTDKSDWSVTDAPSWGLHYQYRVKPEPKYPVTSLTEDIVDKMYNTYPDTHTPSLIKLINDGIKQAILDGDVIINPDRQEK